MTSGLQTANPLLENSPRLAEGDFNCLANRRALWYFLSMKLTREQVEKMSGLVLKRLKDRDLIEFKAPEARVLERITDAVLTDLKAEDGLDREVEEVLKSHTAAIDGQKIDYRKMFSMIKTKLARERGIVL